MNHSFVLKSVMGLALIGVLAACGDGGGGVTGETAVTPPTLVGVAASGAPIAGAALTITCSDGTTKTGTTDANGAYSVNVDGCSAPYVISVTGTVGDAQITLVSVQATAPAAGSPLTVNVTPLTHAIAATLASTGDPLDLAANIATEKTGITAAAIKARKDALAAALADTLTAAGLDATKFDIISSTFSADRTGMDKVLDNVKVEVTSSGVNITNPGGVKVDDMGDKGATAVAADLSAGSISISKNTNFATPLAKLPATADDNSVGDSIRDLLTACFAQAKATRGSIAGTLSAACQAVPIASDYLHDGRTGSQELDRFLTDAKYDGAKFNKPEVIRFFSNSATDSRALVKFTLVRADGVVESFSSVGEQSTATGGTKKLRGNQRPFKVFVNGFVNKRVQIETRGTTAKSTYYSTGVNLYVGFLEGGAGGSASGTTGVTGRKVDYVKVTGPGLPATGVFLNPKLAGCDSYYAIATSATATPVRCTSLFRMSSRAASATDSDNYNSLFGNTTRPEFAAVKVTDANLVAIQPFSAYKFEVWRSGNATVTPSHVFYERLRSRPNTMGTVAAKDGEIDKVRWNTLSADTIAAINPLSGKAFAGGNPSSFTANWTNEKGAAPTYSMQVQTNPTGGATTLSQDQVFMPFSATSIVLTNGTQGWPNMGSTGATTAGAFNLAQLISRNQYDTQVFADWFY